MRIHLWLLAALALLSVGKTWGSTADEYYKAGLRFYGQGQYEKALEYFKASIQLDGESWSAYQGLGLSYYRMGKMDEALDALGKSLSLHPDNDPLRKFVQSLRDKSPGLEPEIPLGAAPPGLEPGTDQGLEVFSRRILRFSFVSKGVRGDQGLWFKAYGGYNHSQMGDLSTALRFWQSYFQGSGYTVTPSLDNSGLVVGTELGLSLDDKNSISLSVDGVNSGNYSLHADNGSTPFDQSITPYLLAVSLNYYRYLPGKNNRFYVGAGLGYGEALVHYQGPMAPSGENGTADLWGGGIQGSVQVGEEFILVDSLVLEVSIKGRSAYIPKVEAALPSGTAALEALPVGNTILANEGFAAANGYHFSSIDFTGPDVKLSLNVYF